MTHFIHIILLLNKSKQKVSDKQREASSCEGTIAHKVSSILNNVSAIAALQPSSFGPILYHQMLSAVVWSQSTVSLSRTPNLVSLLEGGTVDRKLVGERPFDPLIRSCSSPRAPAPFVYCCAEQSCRSSLYCSKF